MKALKNDAIAYEGNNISNDVMSSGVWLGGKVALLLEPAFQMYMVS